MQLRARAGFVVLLAACAPGEPAESPRAGGAAGAGAAGTVAAARDLALAGRRALAAASAATSIPAGMRLMTAPAVTVPAAAGPSAKDWIAAVPSRPVAARVDDTVWAAFPAGDEVRIEPCRVRAVGPAGATLEADDHSVHENVSGALVHVAADQASLKIGDLVTYFDWRRDLGIAVITRRDWAQRLEIKFRDSARVVRQEIIHVAEPLATDVGPLAWVAFPYPPAPEPRPLYRGLVFAADAARLFVRDDANRAWVVPREGVKLLAVSAKPRREGDPVSAFEYGEGYRPGTVKKVFDPGFAYGVERVGETSLRSFYFSEIIDAL